MYASKSGNTLAIAESLFETLKNKGFTVEFGMMNDFQRTNLEDPSHTSYFIFLTPTVDYGKIPPNGEYFLDHLEELYKSKEENIGKFSHLKFAMFGLGDSEYVDYQVISK